MAVPIRVDGRTWGRLIATAPAPRSFTAAEVRFVSGIADVLATTVATGREDAVRRAMAILGSRRGRPPLPVTEVALLDEDGVIVWVNDAWEDFCRANGGDPRRTGVAMSYLACCDAADDAASAEVGAAIRAAVRGELPAPTAVVIPCDSPTQQRLFDVLVSSRLDDTGRCVGATVTLSLVQA